MNCPQLEYDICVFMSQPITHLKNLNLPIVSKYGILQPGQQLWRQVNKNLFSPPIFYILRVI